LAERGHSASGCKRTVAATGVDSTYERGETEMILRSPSLKDAPKFWLKRQ
jgi:hypothetical protein